MKNQDFFKKVYDVVRKIPYGKVTTYGAIAKSIGSPQAARMVVRALNKSFTESGSFIPAHRVVNRNGLLTGKNHFPNKNTMQEMLESEGLKVIDNKILNFQKYLWLPDVEDFNNILEKNHK